MQTSSDRSDLSDRLTQGIQELSPSLRLMVLEFVEFLLKKQQQLQETLKNEKQDSALDTQVEIARQCMKEYKNTLIDLAQ